MTMRIVHALEPVEVDDHYRAKCTGIALLLYHPFKAAPVGDAGQHVHGRRGMVPLDHVCHHGQDQKNSGAERGDG
jgi:hypothetical protein